mmetsp:Transcript_47757/g.102367  ORF Transcript_47757/g.102367 Transcript_47757/m.102367 type:complete len:376 (-) Transcript_47757:108-1235(-)
MQQGQRSVRYTSLLLLLQLLCDVGLVCASSQEPPLTNAQATGFLSRLTQTQRSVESLEESLANTSHLLDGLERRMGKTANDDVKLGHRFHEARNKSTTNQVLLHRLLRKAITAKTTANRLSLQVRNTAASSNNSLAASDIVSRGMDALMATGQVTIDNSKMCLNSLEPNKTGSEVLLQPCLLDGVTSQRWYFNTSTGLLEHTGGNCLASLTSGEVRMFTCNSVSEQQRWTYVKNHGHLKGSGGQCLSAAGAQPSLVACDDNSKQQRWKVVPGPPGPKGTMKALNENLWVLQDPAKNRSLTAMESQVMALREAMDIFEANASSTAKSLLGMRVQPMARPWLKAIKQLGEAASETHEADAIEVPDNSFGAEVSLPAI